MSKDWMSVRIPSELAEEIRQEAKDRGTTITKVVEERLSRQFNVIGSIVDDSDRSTSVQPVPLVTVRDITDCPHNNTRQAATGIICMDCRAVLKR